MPESVEADFVMIKIEPSPMQVRKWGLGEMERAEPKPNPQLQLWLLQLHGTIWVAGTTAKAEVPLGFDP